MQLKVLLHKQQLVLSHEYLTLRLDWGKTRERKGKEKEGTKDIFLVWLDERREKWVDLE